MTIEFRTVGPEFAAGLQSLWVATFEQAYHDEHRPENIRRYCTENFTVRKASSVLSDEESHCVVGCRDGEPVGFYLLIDQDCPLSPGLTGAELKQIYILSAEYGSGLGRLLFDHALDAASGAGNETLWLSVSDRNQRAQAFYRKLGFQRLGPGPKFHVGTETLTSTTLQRVIGP